MAKDKEYSSLLSGVSQIINEARGATVKTVNSIMTATYWEIGRTIVENEQKGKKRADYGEEILKVLSADLRQQFGRGFGVDNLQRMRLFYQLYSPEKISATLSHISEIEDVTLNIGYRLFTFYLN